LSVDRLEKLSKFLSLILRHKPEILNIRLRKDGFVDLEELIEKIKKRKGFTWVRISDIKRLIEQDKRKRFEIVIKDGKKLIRARYGHSKNLPVSITYEKVKLGEVKYLYHGTRADVLPWILKEGLKPMARKYVHLSASPDDAIEVAKRRRGKTVILKIDAEEFIKEGGEIFKATEKVYLAKEIPPKYIHIYKYGV